MSTNFFNPQTSDHPVNYLALVKNAADYVRSFTKEHHNPDLFYHNLAHTKRVVAAATEITRHYGVGGKDLFVVLTAAWFHDIGYFEDPAFHERVGASKAEQFLRKLGVDDEVVNSVTATIMATRVPQSPTNRLEEILCDADLYHLGTEEFWELNRLLHKEMEAIHHINISREEWLDSSIHLLASHHYFTDYCKVLLKKKKKANLEKMQEKFQEQTRTVNPIDELVQEQKQEKRSSADAYDVRDKPERGVEALFRIASGISQRLNEQADSKAHILISVNAIIISVLLTLVVRRLELYEHLILPVGILLCVNLVTITFSILATRPSTPFPVANQAEQNKDRMNLLFFGNFFHLAMMSIPGVCSK